MDTQVRTPQAIFMQPQRLLVPLFQRPYVWNEELQWEPLWKDLERVATRLLQSPHERKRPIFSERLSCSNCKAPRAICSNAPSLTDSSA